jgi:Do/DeqQ family serine protease
MVSLAPGFAYADDSRIVPDNRTQIQMSYAPLVKKVAPAVVNVFTKRTVTRAVNPLAANPFFQQLFGGGYGGGAFGMPGGLSRRMVENALGTGVIVDPKGLIVTNAHVVEGADEINVVLNDGREFVATKMMVDKSADIAVLRIDAKGPLPYVTLEPSEKLEVGDLVIAIGNPFGVGQTVTSGIVSALARSSLDVNDYNYFIQTDAAINPGNSGGPLVAMDGGVVGINAAIYSKDGGSLGIGFAIPSEMVAAVLAAVKSGQTGDHIVRPWIGVTTQKVTSDIAQSLGQTAPRGLLVTHLHQQSPMRQAGIQIGDVILAIDSHPVNDAAELKFHMATVPVGGDVAIDISRKGQPLSVTVKAIAPPEMPPRNETAIASNTPLNGAAVANINPADSLDFGLSQEQGVVVMKVDPQSTASQIFEPGDIVAGINGVRITDVGVLQEALNNAQGGWMLDIISHGQHRRLMVR